MLDREIELCNAEIEALQSVFTLHSSHIQNKLGATIDFKPATLGAETDDSEYEIKICDKKITVKRSNNLKINKDTFIKLFSMDAFVDWCKNFDKKYFEFCTFESIVIHSIFMFGPRVGFLQFQPIIHSKTQKDGNGNLAQVSAVTFMRGGSVAMLPVFHCETTGQVYVCLTVQNRVPAGQYEFAEIPAGMLDANTRNFAGVAAKEMKEEMGIEVKESELIDMLEGSNIKHGNLPGIFLTPGGCDEYMRFLLYRKTMTQHEISQYQGRLTGNIDEGESIALKIVKFNEVAKTCADAKTLTALYLYSHMPDSLKLPPELLVEIILEPGMLLIVRNFAHAIKTEAKEGKQSAWLPRYEKNVRQIPDFIEKLKRGHKVHGLTNEELGLINEWIEQNEQ